jgi:type III secretion protein J
MLVALCAPLLAGCKVALDHNLSERQANAVVALLLAHDIPAAKQADKTGNYTVMVEQQSFATAYTLQRDDGLPRQTYASVSQIFGSGGLVASPAADQARLIFVEEQQLDSAISSIDGVTDAHVLIVQPPEDPLAQTPPKPTASVLVNVVSGSHAESFVPQVKMLVADGVRGLDYSHVSVVMIPETAAAMNGPRVVSVLGIWVVRGSVAAVEFILGFAALMAVGLVGLGSRMLWQRREMLQARSRQLLSFNRQ